MIDYLVVDRLMWKINRHNELVTGDNAQDYFAYLSSYYEGEIRGMKKIIELVYQLRITIETDTHGKINICVRTGDKKKVLYSSLDPGAMRDCLQAYEREFLAEPEGDREETYDPFGDLFDEDDIRQEILK
jgi:hypothetical protein